MSGDARNRRRAEERGNIPQQLLNGFMTPSARSILMMLNVFVCTCNITTGLHAICTQMLRRSCILTGCVARKHGPEDHHRQQRISAICDCRRLLFVRRVEAGRVSFRRKGHEGSSAAAAQLHRRTEVLCLSLCLGGIGGGETELRIYIRPTVHQSSGGI